MTDIKHYLQQPSLKNHHLAFVSEDDLWICDLNNMRSQRLTTDFGEIKNPHISPCGQHIAFSSNREGSIEVYVISISGGNPKKLTYTGDSCLATGWKDPDTIIVSSTFERPFRQGSLYTIAKNGGDLCEINVGPANAISYGPEDNTMVIQRHGYGYPSWKRYRGGTCAELWLKRSKSRKFSLFCKQNANMIQPVLYKNRVYFISDFQGHGNVYSANLDGLDIRRHTNCEGFYVRSFSIDQDRIIYAQAGQLFSVALDLKSVTPPSAKHLSIETASVLHHTTRKYDFSEKSLEDISPNHNASQLALCHRGRLFTMPTFQGPATLIDNNDQKRYRHCCWLQKTSSIFAICDDGHHDFPVVFDQQKPESKPKKWQKIDLGKVLCLQPSPASTHILLANQRHELLLLDTKTGKLKTIAHSAFATIGQFDWSEDGQWLCYRLANSHETAKIMLYHVKKDSHTEITRGHYNDYSPCFDPDGKYLYFLSHRSLTPSPDELCFQYNFSRTAKAYVCCLDETSTDPFYHNPSDPTDEIEDEKEKKSAKDDKKEAKKKKNPEITVHLTGITERILPFPVDAGKYTNLLTLSGKVLFLTASWADRSDYMACSHDNAGSLSIYDFKELKYEHLFDGINGADLSHDRAFLCYSTPSKQVRIIPAGSKPDEKDESYRKGGLIDIKRARVATNPQNEWQFMLKEAWRLQRDFFWDKNMGDVPWDDILNRYLDVAKRITTRHELNDLIAELHGELGSSHAYVIGGDTTAKRNYNQGTLGAQTVFDAKEKAYRITDIIDCQDHSSSSLLSPLKAPGVSLDTGDLIHAINGQPSTKSYSVCQALEQQAGQYAQLQISRKSQKSSKKSLVTIQVDSDNHDRIYRSWVEKNRRYVSEKSDGKLGYIHIPDMSKDGYAEFLRSFLQSFDCQGLVVDVRFNGGGHVSSLILQKLALKRFGLDATRWHDANFCYPANAPKGCMVAICNEYAGSDGDMFSYAFKKMQLGKLIGKRTWGGVIGINVRHDLLDGGVTTQPEYAIWLDGVGYGVENHGVDPDEVIEITPEQAASGQDPQLDRAISIALDEIKHAKYEDLDKKLADTGKPCKKAPALPKSAMVEA